jgi:hypothetical protein
LQAKEELSVYKFYMDLLSEIMTSHREKSLYYFALEVILNEMSQQPKASKGIPELFILMSSCYSHIVLSLGELKAIANLVDNRIRVSVKHSIYDAYSSPVLNNFAQLLHSLFSRVNVQADTRENELVYSTVYFEMLCLVFGHWILVDSFVQLERSQTEFSTALLAFIKTINEVGSPYMLQNLLNLYYSINKPEIPNFYLQLFTDAMQNVNWNILEVIDMNQMDQMLNLLALSKTSSNSQVILISNIVCKIPWSKVVSLPNFNPDEAPQFYKNIAILFGHVIVRNKSEWNKTLEMHIQSLKWDSYITNDILNMILQSYYFLFTEFNIKMTESAETSIDLMFQILQRFIKLNTLDSETPFVGLKIHPDYSYPYKRHEVNRNAILITYMRFLLHLFSVILQKKDKDGELYIYLEKNREGLYQFCVRLILDRGNDRELLSELVKVFNVCQIQFPFFSALSQMVLRMVVQKNDPHICIELLKEGYNAIGISDQLALFSETCIRVIILSASRNMDNNEISKAWKLICDTILLDEEAQYHFIQSCIKQGCAGSLYAIALKELARQEKTPSQITSMLAKWIQKIDMLHAAQAFIMSQLQEINGISTQQHQDNYLITLLRLYLDLVAKENIVKIERKELVDFIEALLNIYTSNSSSKISSMFKSVFSRIFASQDGANDESRIYRKHTKQMKWLCVMIATFLMSRINNSMQLLPSNSEPEMKETWRIPYDQMLANLTDLKNNSSISHAVSITQEYITNPDRKIQHASSLFHEIYPIVQSSQ